MKDRKKIFEAVFFITVTVLALSVLFRGQNWSDLLLLIRKSNPVCLLSAAAFSMLIPGFFLLPFTDFLFTNG